MTNLWIIFVTFAALTFLRFVVVTIEAALESTEDRDPAGRRIYALLNIFIAMGIGATWPFWALLYVVSRTIGGPLKKAAKKGPKK